MAYGIHEYIFMNGGFLFCLSLVQTQNFMHVILKNLFYYLNKIHKHTHTHLNNNAFEIILNTIIGDRTQSKIFYFAENHFFF